MKTRRHKNIPFFIPHEGCGHRCIFCSQAKITGVRRESHTAEAEVAELHAVMKDALPTLGNADCEIAFFGGSFTGIERSRMTALLEAASSYIGRGVSGIRLSTRPDYIDEEICAILKQYGVTAVELGIQSTCDSVLAANKRGHNSLTGEKACSLIKENGFLLTGQMMTGMYSSSRGDELRTARDIVSYGADSTRIYPTVVFADTELYDLTVSGAYIPLTTEEAVERSADCAEIFIENGVEILRIGLHSSENLAEAPFGAKHPALGELAEGEIYYRRIRASLAGRVLGSPVIYVPEGCISKAVGQKKINKNRLCAEFGFTDIRFREDASLSPYFVRTEENCDLNV